MIDLIPNLIIAMLIVGGSAVRGECAVGGAPVVSPDDRTDRREGHGNDLDAGYDAMQGKVMRVSRRGRSYGAYRSPTRLMIYESRQDLGTAVFLDQEEARAYAQRRLDVMAKVFASLAGA